MDESERQVQAYLQGLGFKDVRYEPDGNVPPDFVVDGEYNVAVIERLRNGGTTAWDHAFWEHELMESGYVGNGMGVGEAHLLTPSRQWIEYKHGFQEYIYNPEIIAKYKNAFNRDNQRISGKILQLQ